MKIGGKKVVIIGGGRVAERKVNLLLESGAKIFLISPQLTNELNELFQRGKIKWLPRKYRKGDLKEAFIGIFAASDSKAKSDFFQEARERGILVNIAGDFRKCDFIFPAVVQKGRILVGVTTQGAFPLLSKELASEIEKTLSAEFDNFIDFLFEIREEVKKKFPPQERKKILESILNKKSFILKKLRKGKKPKLEELL